MRSKRGIAGLLALCLATALLVAGCGSSDNKGGGEAKKKDITIGFTTIVLADPFFVKLNNSMKAEAKKQGVDLILNNPNGDPAAQANAVEGFTEQHVDVIMFDAIDPKGILPSLKAAQAAGIPVVAVDEVLKAEKFIDASVGVDDFAAGKHLGQTVVREAAGKEAQVGITNTFDAPIENTRVDGFRAGIKGHDNVSVVGHTDAKFSIERAANGAEDMITANPKLNWFFTVYPAGTLPGIKAQNKEDSIRMVTFGGAFTPALTKAMKDGLYVEAALQDVQKMGASAVDVAVKLAQKQDVPRFTFTGVDYVTKANVDEFTKGD